MVAGRTEEENPQKVYREARDRFSIAGIRKSISRREFSRIPFDSLVLHRVKRRCLRCWKRCYVHCAILYEDAYHFRVEYLSRIKKSEIDETAHTVAQDFSKSSVAHSRLYLDVRTRCENLVQVYILIFVSLCICLFERDVRFPRAYSS